jgi:hypothetical protein
MNIKKIALALGSAFMLFANTLKAQEQPWSFGVKGGGGMSWLAGLGDKKFGDNKSDGSFKAAFGGGLTAGYAFHENVSVGLEVLYTALGGEAKETPENASKNTKASQFSIRTHNLVVPLMVKFFPMDYDPEEGILDIHLGLQGVLPLSSSVEKSTSGDKDKLEGDQNFKKEYLKMVTLGALLGVGYEFPEIGLTLEGRYHYGFMDIFKNEAKAKKYKENNGLKDKSLQDSYFTASLGYNFARLLMD